MHIIVGLGNPGKEYQNTRHNIGFMVLDSYLKEVKWKKSKNAYTYKTTINNEEVLFIKPTTFMNLSGIAVRYYVNFYKVDINNILVIQDDLDLPLATVKLKKSKSSGGHNGIKNITAELNTPDFLRLKIGISHPNDNVIDYVLTSFSKQELDLLNESFNKAHKVIEDFISGEKPEVIMNKFN